MALMGQMEPAPKETPHQEYCHRSRITISSAGVTPLTFCNRVARGSSTPSRHESFQILDCSDKEHSSHQSCP